MRLKCLSLLKQRSIKLRFLYLVFAAGDAVIAIDFGGMCGVQF
jgi:hypothetical protein